MGVLQQGFNQALTGATFLLQQTPWWQDKAETQKEFTKVKKLDEGLWGLAKSAAEKGNEAKIASEPPVEPEEEEYALEAIDKAERFINRYDTTKNEIDIRTAENPSLGKKYDKWKSNYDKDWVIEGGNLMNILEAKYSTEAARKALMERQNQYSAQKAQQEEFKNNLKISKHDAEELAAMGIGKESIKGGKYN